METCWELGGGSGGGVDAHKPVPAPFLTKTYQLVDDPSTDHIVSWGDDRVSTFVVWRPPEFARDLLPNYFKHNNFSSFVRQLNTYGFRKVVPERWEFANEFFKKGEKHLLCEIHRRKTSSSSTLPIPSPSLFPLYHHPHFDEHHLAAAATQWRDANAPRLLALGGINGSTTSSSSAGIGVGGAGPATAAALLEENERLRRSNGALLSELSHMRKLYNDIIYFVQNHVRPVAPSSTAAASANLLFSGGPATASAYHRRGGRNSGSTTSSSSLTIAEEPSPMDHKNSSSNNNNSNGDSSSDTATVRPKLFGVTLDGAAGRTSNKRGRRAVEHDEPASPSTKPRLTLEKEDLALHIVPPSPSSC